MYLPPQNAEFRLPELHSFIEQNPLGILTTAIRNPSFPFLQSSHIPWIIDPPESTSTEKGLLRGHIARQNPQAKAIIESLAASSSDERGTYLEEEVLILFNAPAQHYITPKFYLETKPTTGKVVPTWNYEAVQVYGKAKVYVDSRADEDIKFLTKQISDLTDHAEMDVMGYGTSGDKEDVKAWAVSDAPERYVELLRKNIIGIEVEITSIAGRFKMSQEKPKGDREGVIQGLKALDDATGVETAETVARRITEYDLRKAEKSQKS